MINENTTGNEYLHYVNKYVPFIMRYFIYVYEPGPAVDYQIKMKLMNRNLELEQALVDRSWDDDALLAYFSNVYKSRKILKRLIYVIGKKIWPINFTLNYLKYTLHNHEPIIKYILRYFKQPKALLYANMHFNDERLLDAFLACDNAIKYWYELSKYKSHPKLEEAIRTSIHPDRNKYWAAYKRWGL